MPFIDVIRRTAVGGLAALIVVAHAASSHARPPATDAIEPPQSVDLLFDELDDLEDPPTVADPLEPVNRGTFLVNRLFDHWFVNPIAQAYGHALPDRAKRALRRFLINLDSPSIFVNDLLQREWKDAATCFGRFAVNTSVGLGGLADPATPLGMAAHRSDFGQTLALGGVGSGPYLMLPLLGPVMARDGFGYLVDALLRPTTFILSPAGQLVFNTIEGGASGIVAREANADRLRALEESSVDYYAALRSAYYQDRVATIWDRREHHRSGAGEEGSAKEATQSEEHETVAVSH